VSGEYKPFLLRLYHLLKAAIGGLVLLVCTQTILPITCAQAGAQQEESLNTAMQLVLHQALINAPAPNPEHLSEPVMREQYRLWFAQIDPKLESFLSTNHLVFDELSKKELRAIFLQTIWYESIRAGLEPSLVLGMIEVESGFNKFAISPAGAVGYMQVMPFWVTKALERSQTRPLEDLNSVENKLYASTQLLRLQTNVRFGCTIYRHYLEQERSNSERALGRYNGSTLDKRYAQSVIAASQHWLAQVNTRALQLPELR